MHDRVWRRPDGVLEIRPLSWRDQLLARDAGTIAGLLVACVLGMSLVIAGVLYAGLRLEGAIASASSVRAGAHARVGAPARRLRP